MSGTVSESRLRRAASRAGAVALLALCSACATVPAGAPASAASAVDPWEKFNRKVYAFNDAVDRAVLEPVARAYRDHVPQIVRTSVDNVLGNIYDLWSAANHLLQGKVQSGVEMGMRVLTNTVLGAGGIMDPASEMGLTRRSEDFGQTLGVWGAPNGPFVMLPLLGPSTVRDTAGLLVDRQVAPSTFPDARAGRYSVAAVEVIDARANLLATGSLVDQVALDKYSFLRDAYLSRRRDALYDGAPPMETFDDESEDADAPATKAAAPAAGAASAPPAPSPAASAASAASVAAPAATARPASQPAK